MGLPRAYLLLAACSSPHVGVSEDWGPDRWQGYPDNENSAKSHWSGEQLLVDVVVNWTSSNAHIDIDSVRAVAKADSLVLCYAWKLKIVDSTTTRSVGVSAPVRLLFTVSGLPRRKYEVSVIRDCPNPT